MNWKITSSVGIACSVAVIVTLIEPSEHGLKISKDGLSFIGQMEGCRRAAYYCSANTRTWGIGSTSPTGNSLASDERIAKAFVHDISRAEKYINRKVNLPAGPVHDMAVSFVFNLGATNFYRSTFLKKLRAGDFDGACDEFPRWIYVSGKNCRIKSSNCAGIVKRRELEKEICLHGYASIN